MASKRTIASKLARPRRIVISEEEFSTGITNLDNVQAGVEDFQNHGFVILENAIGNDVVDKVGNQMRTDAAASLTFPDLVFNHGNEHNNFSITPPLSDELMFEEIWANRHAAAIMHHIIGPRPILCWASSNVAIQSGGTARQAVHSDAYADIPNFPFCAEMNIYLQDTTPENGSTEIWPGTHVFTEDDHLPNGRGFIQKKALTNRARTSPPIQPNIPAGSIMIRDLRLWHAGMPNTSPTPRIIVALLYFPPWFRPLMRLTLPMSVRPKAETWTHIDLLSNTDFVEGSVDHLRTRFPMNFTQDPAKALVEYRRAMDRAQGREPGAVIPVTKSNYWTPSRYETRAAGKRKRDAERNDDEDKTKQKQEETKPGAKSISREKLEPTHEPETKQKVVAEQEPEMVLQPEITQETEVMQEHEIEQVQKPKVTRRPWLTHEPEITHEEQFNNTPKQTTNFVDDLPDYKDSPGYPPEWMKRLQDDKAAAARKSWDIDSGEYEASGDYDYLQYFSKIQPKTHTAEPKQVTEQLQDLPKYDDFPHFRQNDEEYEAAEQAWVSAAQKATFKLNFVPYSGPGPGISPQFSPTSKPKSPLQPNTTQEAKLEKQVLENLYKQDLAPVEKMTTSPWPQTPPPKPRPAAQAAWERDPRPYKGSRPSTPKFHPLGARFKSTPSRPSHPPQTQHASRATGPSSDPLSHPATQHLPPRAAQQPKAAAEETAPRQPNATDAYDAYIQAQLLEKQERELKRAELKRLRDGKRMEAAAAEEQKGDGLEEEWLSVEESRERECGW